MDKVGSEGDEARAMMREIRTLFLKTGESRGTNMSILDTHDNNNNLNNNGNNNNNLNSSIYTDDDTMDRSIEEGMSISVSGSEEGDAGFGEDEEEE